MKDNPLVSCAACKRGTRDGRHLLIAVNGVTVVDVLLCRACESDVTDHAERIIGLRSWVA